MKYSQVTISFIESLRFFTFLMICSTILVHISATESLKDDDAHGRRQELPRLIRQRRAVKKNVTTNPQDNEERLKILEDRYVLTMQFSEGRGNSEAKCMQIVFRTQRTRRND